MKKSASCSILLIGGLLLRSAAFAQGERNMPLTDPTESKRSKIRGVELGFRAGYGVPLGRADGNVRFSEAIAGMVPLWVDIGYRMKPNWYLGAFFQYGIARASSIDRPTCSNPNSRFSCSMNNLRFGLNAHYHFMPAHSFDPWIGIGAGYEISNSTFTTRVAGGDDYSHTREGFEFGNLQLGFDYRETPKFGIGPFVTFTIAQFSTGAGVDYPIPAVDKTIHGWLIVGVRGVFDLLLD
jgi:hypothetical protein